VWDNTPQDVNVLGQRSADHEPFIGAYPVSERMRERCEPAFREKGPVIENGRWGPLVPTRGKHFDRGECSEGLTPEVHRA
jgi:hypothetical protein